MLFRSSTAFHPQTDGQTERMNQTLECYLRCYLNYQQDDWVMLLPSAQYACNRSRNASTGQIPFEVVYRFSPSLRMNLEREKPDSENEAAKKFAADISQSVEESTEM